MSVNAVDPATGNTTPLAGNTNNLVGNLSALTTNTKSDAVGAINELNQTKQNATDNNLQTTDKTVAGAINELKSGLTGLISVVTGSIASREYESGAGYYALYNVPAGYIPCGVYFTDGEYASQFAAMLSNAGTIRVMNVSIETYTTALSYAVICLKANS